MPKIIVTIYLTLIFIFNIHAQKEDYIWYFGKYGAGLDFKTDPPTALEDGELFTLEGCATISNDEGSLLFYTNGVDVFNRYHEKMPNGFGLNGDTTSSQSALIVPFLCGDSKYYVFTVDAGEYSPPSLGVYYSVVDMKADNGKGDIILKNKFLEDSISEQLTASVNSTNDGYWIITHGVYNNRFYAYELSASGIDEVPTITEIGTSYTKTSNLLESIGCMKTSSDGSIVVATNYGIDLIQILNFDNSTGLFNTVNEITLKNAYGVEFSPNNDYIYVSTGEGNNTIYSFDLTSTDISTTINEIEKINSLYSYFGALQQAPDGKIYASINGGYGGVGASGKLGVISNPNNPYATENYKTLSFNNFLPQLGLPNMLKKYLKPVLEVNLGKDTIMCSGEKLLLQTPKENSVTYTWQNGVEQPFFLVETDGLYWVEANIDNCTVKDSISVDFQNCSFSETDTIIIPNIFTPNGDEINDVFFISFGNDKRYDGEMYIFNRWGDQVYYSQELWEGWNGINHKDGVYFWFISYIDSKGEIKELKGHITLLR